MPRIIFIAPNGERREVSAAEHESVMEAATRHGVDGIVAECGGSCMCATCHVYVEAAFLECVGEPQEIENEMLHLTASERRAGSRLSCQIIMSSTLDGITIKVAERQI
ncbi:(2Fe-2S)-binding protein [Mesorhizobium sp. B2-4-14]|uniref:2Fe-2S iron-sulfur cluster-binding protein n=1 Tax=Mesorhizobium sp. B2-4-14 TaxID=2589935 RepID=UPI00112746EF|nr:2Fe-2S iron-sulfur cluster-binding protein [Mesorhizobium sp. B2-4-14]TPK96490.1 (2Fe-2S)-binding protein [Mesorhizobium sp. B2-4-14]